MANITGSLEDPLLRLIRKGMRKDKPMAKVIEVKSCVECPHISTMAGVVAPVCTKTPRPEGIPFPSDPPPSWCPLPDAPEPKVPVEIEKETFKPVACFECGAFRHGPLTCVAFLQCDKMPAGCPMRTDDPPVPADLGTDKYSGELTDRINYLLAEARKRAE